MHVCAFSGHAAFEQHALFICTDLQKQRYLHTGRRDVYTNVFGVLISSVIAGLMLCCMSGKQMGILNLLRVAELHLL